MTKQTLQDALIDIKLSWHIAKDRHPRKFSSPHEGYAVLLEEVDELWDEVKKKTFDKEAARKEAVQIGAIVIRFITELC
ncbi:MAG: hypothetical protein DI598_21200 [Pseudopedobacter saltans]|uniref:Pyrophosphatase n=1 Tax=Pseudopedobacter saltans TaxID=151895 RepID=A0A2W5E5S8_9SPHI|nr:MAG: hypothetical protein DI598_21200 [Pseudopedobacter saltans]